MNTITTLLKKQNIDEASSIYNIGESKSYNIKNNRYTDERYCTKKQFITNNLTNYITKKNSLTNTENALNTKRTFPRSIILQMCLGAITTILKIMYIRNMIIESPVTQVT